METYPTYKSIHQFLLGGIHTIQLGISSNKNIKSICKYKRKKTYFYTQRHVTPSNFLLLKFYVSIISSFHRSSNYYQNSDIIYYLEKYIFMKLISLALTQNCQHRSSASSPLCEVTKNLCKK